MCSVSDRGRHRGSGYCVDQTCSTLVRWNKPARKRSFSCCSDVTGQPPLLAETPHIPFLPIAHISTSLYRRAGIAVAFTLTQRLELGCIVCVNLRVGGARKQSSCESQFWSHQHVRLKSCHPRTGAVVEKDLNMCERLNTREGFLS